MIKAMTLLGQDSVGPIDDVLHFALDGTGHDPTTITLNPAMPLKPDAPPRRGGALIAYFGDPAAASAWKTTLDSSTGIEPGVLGTVLAEEHIVRGGDRLYVQDRRAQLDGIVKVVTFLNPTPNVSVEKFGDYWLGSHAALANEVIPWHIVGGGYVQNHAIDEDQPYAGVAESYWDGLDALRTWSEWYQGIEAEPLRRDEENFLDTKKRVIVVTSERVIAA